MDKSLRRLRFVDGFLTISVSILLGLVIIKYAKRERPPSDWIHILDAPVISLDRTNSTLDEELAGYDESFILVLELSNCPSCISKGMAEIRGLKARGKHAIVLVSHPWVEEWLSWTRNYDKDLLFMVNKSDLESLVSFPYLPILISIKKGKIASYKLISP